MLEPSAIDITITEKLKDDVVLTEESYLAGWEYLLYVYVGDEKGGTFSCIRDTTIEEYDYQLSEIPVGYIDQNHQRFNIGVNGNIYRRNSVINEPLDICIFHICKGNIITL